MSNFLLALLEFLTIVCGTISAITFFMYTQARMKENDLLESRYKKIHFTSLVLFCVAGVVLLNMLASLEVH